MIAPPVPRASVDLPRAIAACEAEVALHPNWHARFDYQFTDFDAETVKYPGGKERFDPDANTFRGSLIYKF